MSKIQIISDKNSRSSNIKKSLIKILKKNEVKKSNLIIVIGGDGFMLQTLKKNRNSKKSFYGINSGNYSFLMNKYSSNNLIKNLSKAKMISISPLEMTVSNKNNQSKKHIAINEVKKPNLTIVIGGDGFMLQTLKKNTNPKKSFYGINSGNYGFLMILNFYLK